MGDPARPNVVVVGAGSLGSLVGGLLAEGGLSVTLLTRRPAHPDAIAAQGGLIVLGHGGERLLPIAATANPKSIAHADVVIFLCKALSTRDAAESVKHVFQDNQAIAVSFQNGLGDEDEIAAVTGADRVIGGLTASGARLGERKNVPTPTLLTLSAIIKGLEKANEKRAVSPS